MCRSLTRLSFQLCPPTASYFFEYYISFNRDHIDVRYHSHSISYYITHSLHIVQLNPPTESI